jgi:hypothetical protein
MKAIQTKTQAATAARKSGPFFKKGPGQGFFKPAAAGVQTKLHVGEPGDVYEKEADRAADRVVKGMPATSVQGGSGAGGGVRRKPIFESENDPAGGVQRKCDECEKKEKKVQKKSSGGGGSAAGGSGAGGSKASAAVESGISRSKGSGASLPSATRNQMESSFGADFSGVRVHQDSGAQQMNKELNAQAFTHGKDIYFDSGKYNPSGGEGKRLLAHELTHVVQQTGSGKAVQRKVKAGSGGGSVAGSGPVAPAAASNVIRRSTVGVGESSMEQDGMEEMPAVQEKAIKPGIQRAAAAGVSGPPTLASVTKTADEGVIVSDHKVVLKNFPLKTYKGVDKPKKPKKAIKPKPNSRETSQEAHWRAAVKDTTFKDNLNQVADNPDPNKLQKLTVKYQGAQGSKKSAEKKSEIVGKMGALQKAAAVPFWTKSKKPQLHQIEHIIDWQIAGNEADGIENNLVLVDDKTNAAQNRIIQDLIIEWIKKVQKPYQKAKVNKGIVNDEVNKNYYHAYTIEFNGFQDPTDDGVKAESAIQPKDLADSQGVISKRTIEIGNPRIPKGFIVIKTSGGANAEGYIVKENFVGPVVTVASGKGGKGPKIKQRKLITSAGKAIKGAEGGLDFKIVEDPDVPQLGQYYKLIDDGTFSGQLKQKLKVRGLSPIEINPSVEFSPLTGIKAEGKVKSDISLLKDADISFLMDNGEFSISATITSDALKGKLPKPLNVESVDLSLSVGTGQPWSLAGGIEFSIKNVGTGYLGGFIKDEQFGFNGSFTFDESKYYSSAKLSFGYIREGGKGEGNWSGNGELVFAPNVVPGIKGGNISIGYAAGVLSGSGSIDTTIPKLDKLNVAAKFDENGNFMITGDTALKGVPGIKDNHITATLTRDEHGYSLAAEGTATPNLPNIPGLGATLTVSYNKGVFTLQGTATYQKDKLDGSLTVGVTNAVVDDNGVPSKETEDGKLKIFGSGSITLHLLKGVDATLQGAVDGKGEMYISGKMDVTATPFDPVDIDKKIFDVKTSIPLVGVPFASINLDLSSSASFHFHWDPLTIHLEATLDRTNIKEIGKAGGELTANLSSQAEAGFMFKIGAGVSLSVAIIKLGAHINGGVDLGLKAEVGASAKAHWDMQKGLQLEEAEAHLSGVPTAALVLSGDITADVDLWLTSYNVYKKEMTFAKKQLDLSQFAFGLAIPLKIDNAGKIEGIDYSKLKVTPELGKGAGDSLSDQVLNGDDKKEKERKEREAKEKIREKVIQKLQSKKSDGETNLRSYAEDLKDEIMDDTPKELQGLVDQVIEEELRKMEKEKAAADAAAAAAANPPDAGSGASPVSPSI